jgi:hypothetical protein
MMLITKKGKQMRTLLALVVLCLSMSAPSFGAEHLVGRSARFAGKESFKAAKFTAKSGETVLKFVF